MEGTESAPLSLQPFLGDGAANLREVPELLMSGFAAVAANIKGGKKSKSIIFN